MPFTSKRFADLTGFLEAALAAHRAGHVAAAQALAASVLDTLLREAVHPPVYEYYGKVKQTIEAEVRWVP